MSGHRHNKVCQSTICKRELSQLQCMACHKVVYQTMEKFVLPKQLKNCKCLYTYSRYSCACCLFWCRCQINYHSLDNWSQCALQLSFPGQFWLAFISVIFQTQFGASCLAGCPRNQGSKCQVPAHRLCM